MQDYKTWERFCVKTWSAFVLKRGLKIFCRKKFNTSEESDID